MSAPRKTTETVDIKIRMKEPLRAQIERAAERGGVSMNAEMIERLESSFRDEASLASAFSLAYGEKAGGLMLLIAQTFHDTGLYCSEKLPVGSPDKWMGDPYAYDQAVKAISYLLESARPDGKIVRPNPANRWHKSVANSQAAEWMVEDAGEMVAREQIRFMNSEKGRQDRWVATIKRLLGQLATTMGRSSKPERSKS